MQILSAVKGQSILSAENEQSMVEIFHNVVPETWKKVAYISDRPLATFLVDLAARINFLTEWAFQGEPSTFWLAGTYHPKMLLSGNSW